MRQESEPSARRGKMAPFEVIINETHSLHECIAGCGPHERPAALFEILAEGGGFGSDSQSLRLSPSEGGRTRLGAELKKVGVKRIELGEEIESALSIVDGRKDLATMANDTRIVDKPLNIGIIELGHLIEIEVREGSAEVFALAENGEPGEASLKSFETDFLEEPEVIGDSPAPFFVVIADVFGVVSAPPAAGFVIGSSNETIGRSFHGRAIAPAIVKG